MNTYNEYMSTSKDKLKAITDERAYEGCSYEDILNRAFFQTDMIMQNIQRLQQCRAQIPGGVNNEKYRDMAIEEAHLELLAAVNAFYVALVQTLELNK